MKKIITFLLVVLMTVSLIACQEHVPDGETKDTENVDANDKENNDVKDAVSDSWKTVVFGATEDSTIFHVNEKASGRFNVRDHKAENVKKEIKVDLWGTEYRAIYEESLTLPRSDTRVHVYELETGKPARILIDVTSNQIVEYSGIPYDLSNLKTEEDFTDVIGAMVKGRADLSEHDYKCTTHYYSFSENGFSSGVVDGFKICNPENEKLGTYSFYYTKSVNGMKTQDHIAAEFTPDKLSLEIYEYDYDEEIYAPLLENMDAIKASVEKHLRDNVKKMSTIVDIKHGSCSLFVQDGIPCVMIRSTVKYKSGYYKNETFDVDIVTITGKFAN